MAKFYRNSIYLFIAYALCVPPTAYAQAQLAGKSIQSLIARIDTFGKSHTAEKLYIQTDKPYYNIGDTIWFKGYLLEAGLLTPSQNSAFMYVELADNNNKVVKRIKTPVVMGLSWGNLALDDEALPTGNYTFRGYTNWQRNFTENYIFQKSIYISAADKNTWLVNLRSATKDSISKRHINLDLAIAQLADHQPVGLRNLQLQIRQNKKIWYKTSLQTTATGALNVNFDIAKVTDRTPWVLDIADKERSETTSKKISILFSANSVDDIDLQFMPEGGKLLTNIPSHVGFKAIGNDGYGVDVNGSVRNSKNEQVASFKSAFKGIGAFDFVPQQGETYTAYVSLANGQTKSYVLPAVQPSGITLKYRIRQQLKDSLVITLAATPDIINNNNIYYLIGHTQGRVCYAGSVTIKSSVINGKISTLNFPTGIATFTLFTADNQPICERQVFVDHNNRLKIQVSPNTTTYHNRDSIALAITVTDANNQPVIGSFSLAVTDDGQVKNSTFKTECITSRLLLASDLKGEIEEPEHYVNADGLQNLQDLDNLLLTQGWVNYTWDQVFTPAPLKYSPELEHSLHGRVTNAFNKGKSKSKLLLIGTRPSFMRDTVADQQGYFTFNQLPLTDTVTSYVLQALSPKGSTFNLGLMVDEVAPPQYEAISTTLKPWFVNSDTTLLKAMSNSRNYANKQRFSGMVLKDVVIKAKKTVPTSHNLNGPGEADFIMDEKELLQTPKLSLLDLMQQKVKGFNMHPPRKSTNLEYFVGMQRVMFIVDGVNLDFFYNPMGNLPNEHLNFVNGMLNAFTAADVKGIEVMFNMSKTSPYIFKHFPIPPEDMSAFAFIEITTRGGSGPFISSKDNMYVYKPMPISLPKVFYRPRYTVKKASGTDTRSTLHWEPNIITDTAGKALVSFFAADLPGTYRIAIEGTDLKGSLGYQVTKVDILPDNM